MCVVVSFLYIYFLYIWNNFDMDMLSLEEDDGDAVFITQEVSQKLKFGDKSDDEVDGLFDFDVPSLQVVADLVKVVPHYSDISDEEDVFEKLKFQ